MLSMMGVSVSPVLRKLSVHSTVGKLTYSTTVLCTDRPVRGSV